LAQGKAVRMALDHNWVDASATVHEGCEVAFVPPVTGG
jgi:molybdopterin synthase sulfur carrier subunit